MGWDKIQRSQYDHLTRERGFSPEVAASRTSAMGKAAERTRKERDEEVEEALRYSR